MLAFGGATDKGAVNGAATNLARSDVQQQNIYVIPVPQSPAVSGINHETESAETGQTRTRTAFLILLLDCVIHKLANQRSHGKVHEDGQLCEGDEGHRSRAGT